VDPRAGLDDVEHRKFFILPGLEIRPLGRPALASRSDLSGIFRTMYLFSLRVVSLLSSRITSSALVWFSNFLWYSTVLFHSALSSFEDPDESCGCLCTRTS
jgi:hypothetical protein